MNVSVPHELYRTPRLRQAARTLAASAESVVDRELRFEKELHLERVVEKETD